jgi:phospholipid/cholesterol/gamma-HCH transport system substrate-binding protein
VRNSSVIGRAVAVAAVAIAIVAVAIIVLSGGSSYEVKAVFANASQIVNGDQVEVAGNSVGSVSDVSLTPDGHAQITLQINDSSVQPLRQGTEATVRLTSLSGIANRYIDLRLGPGTAPKIPSGGTITAQNTTSAVDLDELFNTLDAHTRKGLQNVFTGSASQYAGQGEQIQGALQYLNPAVASASVLFSEINRDTSKFTRFITKTSSLVTDLASRSGALSGLVSNLSTTMGALAAQRAALGQSVQRLPGFMRLANTTFVNLRQALDDLTPLVDVSKPVAPKLQAFLQQLRPLAQQAVPTIQALSTTISKPGANNDLIDLTALQPGLKAVTCGTGSNCNGTVFANGRSRLAAFPQSTIALNDSTPELATGRPYAADLTGWFEGFTHPGTIDANGGTSRVSSNIVGPATLTTSALNVLENVLPGLPLAQQVTTLLATLPSLSITSKQGDRCPGSVERGALWYPQSGYPCNPSEVPTGP